MQSCNLCVRGAIALTSPLISKGAIALTSPLMSKGEYKGV